MPQVSIIVPVYNGEQLLEECLESLINQTFNDIEIICINDGSTDNTINILKKYAEIDSRFIIIDKKNEGVAVARNIGIDIAKGEYLMFLDADDFISINTIETLVEEILKSKADVLNFGIYEYYQENAQKKVHWSNEFLVKDFEQLTFEEKLKLNLFCWSKIYSTKFLKKNANIRFPVGIKTGEDGIFCILVILSNAKFSNINIPFYFYRQDNPNSVTKSTLNAIQTELEGLKWLCCEERFQSLNIKDKKSIVDKFIGSILWYNWKLPQKNNKKFLKEYIRFLEKLLPVKELKTLPNYKKIKKIININLTKIFSIVNDENRTHKIITILGVSFKLRRISKCRKSQ